MIYIQDNGTVTQHRLVSIDGKYSRIISAAMGGSGGLGMAKSLEGETLKDSQPIIAKAIKDLEGAIQNLKVLENLAISHPEETWGVLE